MALETGFPTPALHHVCNTDTALTDWKMFTQNKYFKIVVWGSTGGKSIEFQHNMIHFSFHFKYIYIFKSLLIYLEHLKKGETLNL